MSDLLPGPETHLSQPPPVSDHGGLSGLSDDDHSQYLNEARHDADDHSSLATEVVFADTFDALDINNGGAAVEIFSHSEALAVGDIVEIELVLIHFQNAAASLVYDPIIDLDDVAGGGSAYQYAVDNCSPSTRRVMAQIRDTWHIHSTSSWSRVLILESRPGGTDQNQEQFAATNQVIAHDHGTDDITGTTAITFDLTPDANHGDTQTLYGSIVIRKIRST